MTFPKESKTEPRRISWSGVEFCIQFMVSTMRGRRQTGENIKLILPVCRPPYNYHPPMIIVYETMCTMPPEPQKTRHWSGTLSLVVFGRTKSSWHTHDENLACYEMSTVFPSTQPWQLTSTKLHPLRICKHFSTKIKKGRWNKKMAKPAFDKQLVHHQNTTAVAIVVKKTSIAISKINFYV